MSRAVSFLSALAIATMTAGFVAAPVSDAEAQWRGPRGGAVAPGARVRGPGPVYRGPVARGPVYGARPVYRGRRGPGVGVAAGIAGAAILGGALLAAPRAYGAPVYVDEPDCYMVNRRIWSETRGRYVTVRREVCE